MTTRFAVVGEALVDLVASPSGVARAAPGGSPYNVAVGLARLGQPVRLYARAGRDGYGELLHAQALASGVDLARWRWAVEPTTRAVATLDDAGRAEYEFDLDTSAALRFTTRELTGAAEAEVLHVGSLASWLAPARDLVAAAQVAAFQGRSALVSYDPNLRPALLGSPARATATIEASVAASHLVKASDADVAWLYPGEDALHAARRWLDLGPLAVVITLGASGAMAVVRDREPLRRAAPPIALVDTVGAGDAFMAALLGALADHERATPAGLAALGRAGEAAWAAVIDHALAVASLTCERAGADPPTRAELATRFPPH